jgi:hypothetical protein
MTENIVRVAKGTGNMLQEIFLKTVLACVLAILAILFGATAIIAAAVNIVT